jgi:WXG100 family type VII secretion target
LETTSASAAVMERSAARFEQVDEALQGMLTRLMGDLEVLRGQWQGSGGRSFTQVTQSWAADQRALQRALLQTAAALRTAGRGYRASDDEAALRLARTGAHLELPL